MMKIVTLTKEKRNYVLRAGSAMCAMSVLKIHKAFAFILFKNNLLKG